MSIVQYLAMPSLTLSLPKVAKVKFQQNLQFYFGKMLRMYSSKVYSSHKRVENVLAS